MNLIKTLFHRQRSQPLRAVVATKSENLAVALQKQQRTAQLKQFLKDVPPEQKAEAIKRAATVKFETPEQRFKRMEPDMFRGMRDAPLKVGKA